MTSLSNEERRAGRLGIIRARLAALGDDPAKDTPPERLRRSMLLAELDALEAPLDPGRERRDLDL